MSLLCLTCQPLIRTESSDMDETERLDQRLDGRRSKGPDRNWSGCLLPPPHENKRKALHKRGASMASIEGDAMAASSGKPRLVRSGGMRRDWSFEDLKKSAIVVRM